MKLPRLIVFSLFLTCGLLLSGCSTPWITNTKRSAVEQYLMSSTIERTVDQLDFSSFSGKKAFMSYDYLAMQDDKSYFQGYLELKIARTGLVIVPKKEQAEIVIEPLCGVLATDHDQILVGTPNLPIPLPQTDLNIVIPEIALFKRVTRLALGSFSFNIYKASDHTYIASIIGVKSSAFFHNWSILLIPFRSHNMQMRDTKSVDTNYEFF